MADFHRLNIPVSSIQNIIDAIRSFLTAAGPGPGWVEDASYNSTVNLGELFLETTAGIDNLYVYFNGLNTVEGQAVLQCYWVPPASNGFGGGGGPQNAVSARGSFVYINSTTRSYTLDLFSDENRCVAVLKSAPLSNGAGVVPDEESDTQILYFGRMLSHAGGVNDTYPNLVAGNGLYSVLPGPADREVGFFPESIAKQIGPNNRDFGRIIGNGWEVSNDHTFDPPRNSRGSEAFAYTQDIYVRYPGSEESFSLYQMVLSTQDIGLEQDVTISGTVHYSIPSLLNIVRRIPGTAQSVYLVVKGTVI